MPKRLEATISVHERCKCAEGKSSLRASRAISLEKNLICVPFMIVAYIHRKAYGGACFGFNLQIGNVSFVSLL